MCKHDGLLSYGFGLHHTSCVRPNRGILKALTISRIWFPLPRDSRRHIVLLKKSNKKTILWKKTSNTAPNIMVNIKNIKFENNIKNPY